MDKDEIPKNKYVERIDKIKEYINGNYRKPITLNDFADKELLSIPYLSKFIKKYLEMTFTEYLNSVRLNYALEELINTDKPITRIALENGFSTTFLFNKYFKDVYKITPNEYRKQFKRENKIEDKINNEIIKDTDISSNENDSNKLEIVSSKEEVKVTIDINKEKKFKKHYNKFLNVGYANDILQSILQEHILMIRNELKFEYARFFGIFNEDMKVESGGQKYNFFKIDRVLDFFVNNKIKPFIDLSPKAKSISKNVLEIISLEINAVKYRSIEQWEKLLNNFIIHCVSRYGIEEVEKWYFEVSTYKIIEPNIEDENYYLKYFRIFEITYKTIKKITPNAKVGGPGDHFGRSNPAEFFEQWLNLNAEPDFISMYIYPYSTIIKNGKEEIYHSNDKDFLINNLYCIKETIRNLGFPCKEIIISEWSLTVSSRNYINDSCFKAAYVIKNIIDCVDQVDSVCYLMASDISEEYLDVNLLLQGGTGLVSKNGMKKPSFYAFSFLEKLSETMVQKGKNYIITKNSDNIFTIICHNYKHFNNSYFLDYQENIELEKIMTIYENQNELNISFLIKNVPNGRYRLKSYTVNELYGSILNKWMKLNADSRLRSDEISYLKDVSIPELDIKYLDVTESKLSYGLELQPHEVRLLTFEIDYD
ncbi:helix-turn-helix domain-containing protein [Clostridium sp. YIM B02555]|uniref:GH39 family glycosyl hydrolase n=1 Tax=Clostridium sp. YIM B02555 TaxID=2911968 RepID=UPI001EEF3303